METLHDCLVCRESQGNAQKNCSNEKCKYYICSKCIEIVKNYNKGKFKCLYGCDNKNLTNVFIFEFNDLPRAILMHWTLAVSCFFQLILAMLLLVSIGAVVLLPFNRYYDLVHNEL